MHGQSFDIMKLAAKTLVNTLGENDYVNVAQFSRNVTWVTPCLDTLVQANSRNKRLLFDGIDRLVAHQIASYGDALEFAYKEHEKFDEEREKQDGKIRLKFQLFYGVVRNRRKHKFSPQDLNLDYFSALFKIGEK